MRLTCFLFDQPHICCHPSKILLRATNNIKIVKRIYFFSQSKNDNLVVTHYAYSVNQQLWASAEKFSFVHTYKWQLMFRLN